MESKTHRKADPKLLGIPIAIEDDENASVELVASEAMAVDEEGLIHGGFTFGLADYSAMLAVNHPFVVLTASNVRFLAPVRVGDLMKARARVVGRDGRRREVEVEVSVGEKRVLTGTMTCFMLEEHVLKRR